MIEAPSLALVGFASLIILSPGPLNMMVLALAATGQWRAAVSLLAGGSVTYAAIWGMAAGFSREIAELDPTLFFALQAIGLVLVVWLAVIVATAPHPRLPPRGRTPGVLIGAGIVLANAKVWVTAFMAATLFCDPLLSPNAHVLVFGGTIGVLMVGICGVYIVVGQIAQALLAHPYAHRGFSLAAASAMLLSYLTVLTI